MDKDRFAPLREALTHLKIAREKLAETGTDVCIPAAESALMEVIRYIEGDVLEEADA